MLLHLTDLSSEPIHKQISRQLTEKILAGDLAAGEKLPPPRTLARTQHVNAHTVERAYKELQDEALISFDGNTNVFVNALTPEKKHAIAMQMLAGEQSPLNIVKAVSEELISAFEPVRLAGIFTANLKRHLLADRIYFVMFDAQAKQYAFLPSENSTDEYIINQKDALMQIIRTKTIPTKIEDIKPLANGDLFDELMVRGVKMIVPLHGESEFLGFIALSGKLTSTAYSYHEIMLLSVLARQFTTALNTSRLYAEMLEKRRLEEELGVARQIQQDLLPKKLPNNNRFQIAAWSKPSQAVGGDFYDYLPIDEHRFGLVIADASGKGMPAAMLISQIQAILKSEASHGSSIRETITNLNKHLKRYTSAHNFATLFYGIVDFQAGTCEYANAGHNEPILVREDGEIELLHTTAPALGILQNGDHETAAIKLGSGDSLLFYTDGITETMNDKSEEYGEQRLQEIFGQIRTVSSQGVIDKIKADLAIFQATDALQDDRTMVALKIF